MPRRERDLLVPDQYPDGMITKPSLTFTDRFGCDHSAHAETALLRSAGLENFVSPSVEVAGVVWDQESSE
jgi:hypothetical protein